MKRNLYIIIGLIGIFLGIAAGLKSMKLVFALAAAILVFALLVLDYERVLYVIAGFLVIDYFMRQYIPIDLIARGWDKFLFIFSILLFIYKWFVFRKQKPYQWTPLEFPLIFFIGTATLLMLVNSPDPSIGFEGLRAVIQNMFWFFIAVQLLKSPAGAKRILYILIFIGAGVGLHGIYQYVTKAPMPANWIDINESGTGGIVTRAYSIVQSPNVLGSVMVLLVPICIALIFSETKVLKKLLFSGIAIILAACLVFTGSRTAWLGCMVALAVYFWMKDKRLLILLGVFVVLAYFTVPMVSNRVNYLLSPEYWVSSGKGGRLQRWSAGIEMLQQSPWLGVGLGRFGGAVAMNNKIPGTFYMDNYFLKTAVEMGIIGVSMFCILVYNALVWGLRAIKRLGVQGRMYEMGAAQGIFAGMAGVIIHNMAENIFEVPMMVVYFWLLAGVIMFLGYANTQKSKTGIA